MEFEKTINLTACAVEYIDQREPKPRTVHTQTVVLDGGRISALHRLNQRPAGYISQQFERSGFTVTGIHNSSMVLHSLASIKSRSRSAVRDSCTSSSLALGVFIFTSSFPDALRRFAVAVGCSRLLWSHYIPLRKYIQYASCTKIYTCISTNCTLAQVQITCYNMLEEV